MVKRAIARLVITASAAVIVAGLGARFQAAEQTGEISYNVRQLPSVGGTNSRGNGVNDGGTVSGFSNRSTTLRHAVIWRSGIALDLGTLGGPASNSSVAW